MSRCVEIYGAGLAGCEAAWQCVRHGIPVRIHEMKPQKSTPAHRYHGFAELVCSNSLRSAQVFNAIGLLKEELIRIGSLIMEAAYANEVPAGAALAVDREKFSDYITNAIRNHPLVTVIEEEVTEIPDDPDAVIIVATGPLTSDALSKDIARLTGADYLYFYDAAAPIVDAASVDMDKAWEASRYDKGEAAYLNCPMTKEEYDAFYSALVSAEGLTANADQLHFNAKSLYEFGIRYFEQFEKMRDPNKVFVEKECRDAVSMMVIESL